MAMDGDPHVPPPVSGSTRKARQMTTKFLTNCRSISAARKACPWATLFAKEAGGVWCWSGDAAYNAWLDAGRPRV